MGHSTMQRKVVEPEKAKGLCCHCGVKIDIPLTVNAIKFECPNCHGVLYAFAIGFIRKEQTQLPEVLNMVQKMAEFINRPEFRIVDFGIRRLKLKKLNS